MKCRCGQLAAEGRCRCEACLTKERERTQAKRNERRQLGLCVCCNNKAKKGFMRCEYHLKTEKDKNNRYKAMGKCLSCGSMCEGKNRCVSCCNYYKETAKIRREKRRNAGLCVHCGMVSAMTDHSHCFVCYLKHTSFTHFRTTTRWKELEKLFDEQNGICPYTGNRLVLGSNCELDHIVPKKKGGDKSLLNLQWVFKPVNTAKWHYTEQEFLLLVKSIYEYKKLSEVFL